MNEPVSPLLLRPEEAAALLGIGRSKVYQIISEGRLPSISIGKRRLIERSAVEAYIARLVKEQAAGAPVAVGA